MRLTVLGCGSAFSGCGCNAGYLVDGRVLVDCGAPVPALVRRVSASVHDVRLVLITHFHADHTFMLPTVLGARAYADTPSTETLVTMPPSGWAATERTNPLLGPKRVISPGGTGWRARIAPSALSSEKLAPLFPAS